MALASDALDLLTRQVLDCVCAAIDDTAVQLPDYPGCPCRACVHAGTPAHDNCCDTCPSSEIGGQLHTWVQRIYPVSPFPQQHRDAQGFKGCPPVTGTAVDLITELVRCAPSVDEDGNPPPCEELERTARIVHTDLLTIYRALQCCIPNIELPGVARRGRKFLMGDARVTEPRGGCVSSRVDVTVDLGSACPCPPVEVSP